MEQERSPTERQLVGPDILGAMLRRFRPLIVAVAALAHATAACAQDEQPSTLLDHPADQLFYIGGQINVILQAHRDFPALYSGPQSLRQTAEHAVSRVLTLYTGVRVTSAWSVLFNLESAGGAGLCDALSLAGFTNLDVVMNPSLAGPTSRA